MSPEKRPQRSSSFSEFVVAGPSSPAEVVEQAIASTQPPMLPPNPFPEELQLPPRETSRKKAIEAKEDYLKRYPSESITMRVPGKMLETARAIAERKGIGYQTYLKMLIQEGLERDRSPIECAEEVRPKDGRTTLK